ncbi:MAG: hypothetical protein IKM35_03665 [Bacteroidaceae bacterium]|nr:hypothetical protein [Bacteroidaceae bacterium]
MKKSLFITLMSIAMLMVSCDNFFTSDRGGLQQENDSLRRANTEIQEYYEEMISFITDIDADMQAIKSAENFIIEQSTSDEVSTSAQSRIKDNIELMSQTLQRNRERIAELEKKLNSGNAQSAALRKNVELLKQQIAEKDSLINSLQSTLFAREQRIEQLGVQVDSLTTQVDDLTLTNRRQDALLSSQEIALNKVYYAYAYAEQLRENNILTGGGLFSRTDVLKGDFNQDFFTSADMRHFTSLYLESKKVKVCTSHPSDSYELVKDDEGYYTLHITNPDRFWSASRYLVVELK